MSQETLTAKGAVKPDDSLELKRDEKPNPWISSSGDVAHPESPKGAGGNGNFRVPGTIDGVGKQSITIPQPNSRPGRSHVLSADEHEALEESKKQSPKKNPPPVTTEQSVDRKIKKNAQNVEVNFTISILADLTDQANVAEGYAQTGPVAATMELSFTWAVIEFDNVTKKVKKIDGVNVLGGLIELQIAYALGVKPDQKVAYGRGTTKDDIKNGDITIGFHEHCHLMDWWKYLNTATLPLEFEGTTKMLKDDYVEKQKEAEKKLQAFITAGDALTVSRTDEVGDPTRSKYLKNK